MKKLFLAASIGMMAQMSQACNRYSAADLEDEANDLSNYGGGGGVYVGAGDEFLDFSGPAGSFADPVSRSKVFILTIANANAAARTCLLCPGLIATSAGLVKTGAFNDINAAAGLSGASGSPGSVEMFSAFIDSFPSLIVGVKLATDSVTQLDQVITIKKESPFRAHSSKVISTGTFASENNFNTKILSIPEPFFMDNQTRIEYTVLGSTSISITFFVGTSLNIAKALRQKTDKAKRNIQAVGGASTVAKSLYIGG